MWGERQLWLNSAVHTLKEACLSQPKGSPKVPTAKKWGKVWVAKQAGITCEVKGLVYRDSLATVKTPHELMITKERDNARAEFLVCLHVYFIGLVCFSDAYNSLMVLPILPFPFHRPSAEAGARLRIPSGELDQVSALLCLW